MFGSRWVEGSSRKKNVPLSDLLLSLCLYLEMSAVKLNSSSEKTCVKLSQDVLLRCIESSVLPEKVFTRQSTA